MHLFDALDAIGKLGILIPDLAIYTDVMDRDEYIYVSCAHGEIKTAEMPDPVPVIRADYIYVKGSVGIDFGTRCFPIADQDYEQDQLLLIVAANETFEDNLKQEMSKKDSKFAHFNLGNEWFLTNDSVSKLVHHVRRCVRIIEEGLSTE